MRTYDVLSMCVVGLALGLSPAASFDSARAPSAPVVTLPEAGGRSLDDASAAAAAPAARPATIPRAAQTPFEAFRTGTQALRDGRTDQAVTALEYAAGQGVPGAMWKLGRMYADGDGVDQDKLRAFQYFRNLTRTHAYDRPGTQQARFVASAFVALGHFYLDGIPGSDVKVDSNRAHEMFRYAASYYGDADAQYQLGRLYLSGLGAPKEAMQAARWFSRAAEKGHRGAQAMLGSMLFKGEDGITRQAAKGLFWLTVAKDGAGADEAWITEVYSSALAKASDDERATAHKYLESWMRSRRE